ncbi:hypothetical protein L2750_07495 [Shewanella submarina]|uniref:Uncharacterized protein n=1 Tax=Shewanella submarina TaxID=2016376 RepID=A0ABV7GCR8_9GAMM|nr:hypothetical protein [Shewanella submarina]MCL1036995.1 hypothetical protein [Shewanella submarina]
MRIKTIAAIVCTLAISSGAVAGSSDSSKKLSQGYAHILPASSVLVHSKASSVAPRQSDELVRSLREEWYKDREGKQWYTWEEKQKQADGHWIAIGSGIAKEGSHSYKARP